VPAISLRRTSIENALQAAAQIADEQASVSIRPLRDRVGAPVYVIRVKLQKPKRKAPTRTKVQNHVTVLSIRMLTEDVTGTNFTVKPETVLTAIEVALDIGGESRMAQKTKIRFHEDSGLLIVAGSQQQLRIVRDVVDRIHSDINMQRAMSARTKTKKKVVKDLPPGQDK
jgi:hypothetical protein